MNRCKCRRAHQSPRNWQTPRCGSIRWRRAEAARCGNPFHTTLYRGFNPLGLRSYRTPQHIVPATVCWRPPVDARCGREKAEAQTARRCLDANPPSLRCNLAFVQGCARADGGNLDVYKKRGGRRAMLRRFYSHPQAAENKRDLSFNPLSHLQSKDASVPLS